jgi:hypothetical protein
LSVCGERVAPVAGRAGWLELQSWASAVNEGCNSSRVVRIRLFRYLSILSSFALGQVSRP